MSLLFVTFFAEGHWDLYSKHVNSELSHLLVMHLHKDPRLDGISKAGSRIPKQKFAQKRRIRARIAVDQENRSSQLAEGLHQSKIKNGERFL